MSQILTDAEISNLLREKFMGDAGAHRLSQVLATIFGTRKVDGPTIDGPVTFTQPNGTTPAVRIIPYPGASVPAIGVPGGGGGGLNPDQVTFPATVDPAGLGVAFPVILYGVVQSGSGTTYSVRCWMVAPSGSSLGDFDCTVPAIDAAEQLPADTPGLVWCSVNSSLVITNMLFFPIALYLPVT